MHGSNPLQNFHALYKKKPEATSHFVFTCCSSRLASANILPIYKNGDAIQNTSAWRCADIAHVHLHICVPYMYAICICWYILMCMHLHIYVYVLRIYAYMWMHLQCNTVICICILLSRGILGSTLANYLKLWVPDQLLYDDNFVRKSFMLC